MLAKEEQEILDCHSVMSKLHPYIQSPEKAVFVQTQYLLLALVQVFQRFLNPNSRYCTG